jgi:cytochrome c-type biogenesis protein CcmH/NrfG
VRARTVAALLVLLVLFYAFALGDRAVYLIRVGLRDGDLGNVAFGAGVLLLPVVGLVLVWGEVRFGLDTERLGRRLAEEGGLPQAEPLPRLPSGRVDPEAADEAFERWAAEADAAPDDWRSWYRLGLAYGDARDTSRGRQAMRRAIRLEQAERAASGG